VNGVTRESQGVEGSANANDVWVWMRPHIRFCAIGKCDLLSFFLSFFLSIEYLPLKHGASSYEVSPLLLFNPCSIFSFFLLFLGSFFLLRRDSTH
jgi:hypothetical protein